MIIFAWEHFFSIRLMLTLIAVFAVAGQIGAVFPLGRASERRVKARKRHNRWLALEATAVDRAHDLYW
jgi:hypothetical protein